MVVKTYMNKNGGMNAVIFVYSTKLEIGDKLATWQGIKFTVEFTVGDLREYKSMRELEDVCTGERFRPNVAMSSTARERQNNNSYV
jgi:hypothetical protein